RALGRGAPPEARAGGQQEVALARGVPAEQDVVVEGLVVPVHARSIVVGMHQAVVHLAKRITAAHKATLDVLNEVEKQVEQQAKALDDVSQGRRFDEEAAEAQARLVEALQETLTLLEAAEGSLADAKGRLDDLSRGS